MASVPFHDARIVPRRELVERQTRFACQPRQEPELQHRIATNARIRRLAAQVRLAEIGDHLAVVGVETIEDAIVDAQLLGELPRRLDVLDLMRAETGVPITALVDAVAPELHRDADHLVALLLEKHRRDARVDSTGQSYRIFHGRIL